MALSFPNIDPVALAIGPIEIRWYALAYLAGFLIGWWYAMRLAGVDQDRRPNKDDIDDFITWMVLGVILGGRLGYVLFYNFDYYAANPTDILKVWQGGMAFHGGLIGATVAMLGYSIVRKIPFFQLSDIIAVVAPIGLLFGRIANFINGELFGRVTSMPWGMEFPHAPDGLPRHPSQLYEAALEGVLLFVILAFAYKNRAFRRKPGHVTAFFLFGYGVFRFIIEYFREPDAHLGFIGMGLSMGQILCLPMILLAMAVVVYSRKRYCKKRDG